MVKPQKAAVLRRPLRVCQYLLIVVHVLLVSLLHHLPLPSLLFQGLLDELSHLALLPRLLPTNYESTTHTHQSGSVKTTNLNTHTHANGGKTRECVSDLTLPLVLRRTDAAKL